ncbi:MAG: T9SS type A sorting domain-containing protein [Flavobacteriales bacterium]|nr:T9SS type A sorting domain-containing protein [Flavobacteriales bacterium]
MKNKTCFLLGLIFMFSGSLFAQNYWKTYRKADGLVDSVVVDLSVGLNKVYIATPRGFSVFENGSFTNYDTSNSNLIDQNIKIIRHYQDTVYMVTDSGLTQFVNGAITNYNVDSGLISNEIEDIELDSKGVLWIASLSGISRKVGNQFINDPTKVVYDIGINSGDSVYANVNTRTIENRGIRTRAELYANGMWTRLIDTSSSAVSIQSARFINLANGRVGIVSSNEGAFLVDSVFSLRQITLPNDDISNGLLTSMEIDSKSNSWFTLGGRSGLISSGTLYKLENGDFKTYANGLPSPSVYKIRHAMGKLYLGTEAGFVIANDTIPLFSEMQTIETQTIRAKFTYDGTLFGDYSSTINEDLDVSGLEFPKGSKKSLSYGSELWMSSYVSDNEVYLSTGSVNGKHFRSGTVNNNKTAVAANMISITKDEISFHLRNFTQPNYMMPESIRSWPVDGKVELGEAIDQAPFIDVNNNGCYDPENGDYPSILGDRAIYMIVTDDTPPRRGDFSLRFKMEAHIMIYVFDIPTVDYIDQSVFVRYTLVNRSKRTYKDVRVGIYHDYDVGGFSDDALGCDLNSNTVFAYNADFNDEDSGGLNGYGQYIPFVGTKLINQSLTGHIGGVRARPSSSGHRLNLLDGRWRDSTQLSVGGDGYNQPITQVTDFLYPGRLDKSNEWSFVHPGIGFAQNQKSDVFSLGRISFAQWKPGERKKIDIVVGIGLDSNNVNNYDNYDVLLFNLEKAARFQQGADSIQMKPSYSSCITGISDNFFNSFRVEKIIIYPNPTSGELNVLSNENLEEITIYDLQGKEILTQEAKEALRIQSVSIPDGLKNGLYLIRARLSEGGYATSRFILQK